MKKPAKNDGQFRTHIAEPRWQQAVSILIVTAAIIAWIVWIVSSHIH